MSKSMYVFLGLLTAACGKDDMENMGFVSRSEPRVQMVMPSLPEGADDVKIITHQFYATAYAYQTPISDRVESIYFVDDLGKDDKGREITGVCKTWRYDSGEIQKRQIALKSSWWNKSTFISRQTMLYHELAHCVLGLEHTEEGSGEIMQPSVLGDETAAKNWFDLVVNLFKSDK